MKDSHQKHLNHDGQSRPEQNRSNQTKPMQVSTDQYRPVSAHRQKPYSELRLCDHCAALL